MADKNLFKKTMQISFFLIMVLIWVYTVLIFKQYSYYASAQKLYKQNHLRRAVDNYVMVVYMHTPLSPFESHSISQLLKIAILSKKENKKLLEFYTLERLRSAIYGTRWIATPHKKIQNELEQQLINLEANMLKKDGYKKSLKDTKEELTKIMKTDLAPNPFLSLVGILSFLLFVVLIILGIIKSSDNNRFNYKQFGGYFLVSIIFWFVWLTCMYLA